MLLTGELIVNVAMPAELVRRLDRRLALVAVVDDGVAEQQSALGVDHLAQVDGQVGHAHRLVEPIDDLGMHGDALADGNRPGHCGWLQHDPPEAGHIGAGPAD